MKCTLIISHIIIILISSHCVIISIIKAMQSGPTPWLWLYSLFSPASIKLGENNKIIIINILCLPTSAPRGPRVELYFMLLSQTFSVGLCSSWCSPPDEISVHSLVEMILSSLEIHVVKIQWRNGQKFQIQMTLLDKKVSSIPSFINLPANFVDNEWRNLTPSPSIAILKHVTWRMRSSSTANQHNEVLY